MWVASLRRKSNVKNTIERHNLHQTKGQITNLFKPSRTKKKKFGQTMLPIKMMGKLAKFC